MRLIILDTDFPLDPVSERLWRALRNADADLFLHFYRPPSAVDWGIEDPLAGDGASIMSERRSSMLKHLHGEKPWKPRHKR